LCNIIVGLKDLIKDLRTVWVWVLELHNIQYVAPSFVVVRKKRSLVVALAWLWLKVRKNGLSFFARSKYLQICLLLWLLFVLFNDLDDGDEIVNDSFGEK